jgi:hypothetical protein
MQSGWAYVRSEYQRLVLESHGSRSNGYNSVTRSAR